ncbi:ATP-binding protein [Gorillibacterium massiliense]|uniref:ATP-binding protein n=1 Tax=Gorillibacterium massiliense TaxID=1280390 RepID=UPI0004B9A017|nr:ATP-binding protein [Gorillibacterium massiliense]
MKYTQAGHVKVELKRSSKKASITVSDTGTGMEAKHLKRVFDRCYRVTDTASLHPEGFGFGLAIAKWIVLEHLGSLSAESKPREGSSFTVL